MIGTSIARRLLHGAVTLSCVAAAAFVVTAAAPARADDAPPAPTVKQIAVSGFEVCMLESDASVDCFNGQDADSTTRDDTGDQPGPYVSISVSQLYSDADAVVICGLTPAGDADCWGKGIPLTRHAGPFTLVTTGFNHTCGLTPAGAAECWGYDNGGDTDAHAGPFTDLTAGRDDQTCGVTTSGSITCWGNLWGIPDDHPGPYSHVAAQGAITCGTRTSGAVDCWGAGESLDPITYSDPGPLTDVSLFGGEVCGISPDGDVSCFSQDDSSPSTLQGPFTSVGVGDYLAGTVGGRIVCGLGASGVPDCQASDTWGHPGHPGGVPFVETNFGPGDTVVNRPMTGFYSTSYPGSVNVTYSIASGSLPPGVTMAADGTISGTPTQSGTFSWVVRARNVWGDGTQSVSLIVDSDLDGDGIGDRVDPDIDGDGIPNANDPYPSSADGDGDGINDGVDNCPRTANTDQADLDGDGQGDACDNDIDGDGIPNASDAFPTNPAESKDTDGDGIGDHADNCPSTANADQADLDGDHIGDACDNDIDGDGVANSVDAFPTNPGESVDTDGDGIGNNADTDDDNDGIPDTQDAYPLQHDGPLSGVISREMKSLPSLAASLAPVRAALLAVGL